MTVQRTFGSLDHQHYNHSCSNNNRGVGYNDEEYGENYFKPNNSGHGLYSGNDGFYILPIDYFHDIGNRDE